MAGNLTGIVIGSTIHLDAPIDLPDNTPVNVALEPIARRSRSGSEAWQATKTRLRERPIHGGDQRFTRDELHERR
jgi:hypothetical protein